MKPCSNSKAKKLEENFMGFFNNWDAQDTVSARRHWRMVYPNVEFNTIHEGLTQTFQNHNYIYQSGQWHQLDNETEVPMPKTFMYYCVYGEMKDYGFIVIHPIDLPWTKVVIPALKALIREREGVKRFNKYWSVDFATHVESINDSTFNSIKSYDKYKWDNDHFVLISQKEVANA